MKNKEKRYMDKIQSLGCLICKSEAEIHHPRFGQGLSQRSSNYLVIPLCPEHHRGSLSIHADKRQFEAIYGSELNLLADTIEALND